MARSVNLVIIVGNLTRDPEMRYTPQGHAVTSFGVATNRRWVSEGAEREEVEFHNVVAWNKLAEICNELLRKGRKVYVQGRLQTRSWVGADNLKRTKTEIIADDMVVLDSKWVGGTDKTASRSVSGETVVKEEAARTEEKGAVAGEEKKAKASGGETENPSAVEGNEASEEVKADEIPF